MATRFSRAAAVGMLAVLAAVGTLAVSSGSTLATTRSRPAAAGHALGNSLTIALGSLPPSEGNPFGETYAGPAVEMWPAIFDALTTIGKKGQAAPALASRWHQVNADAWEFVLRHGIKFSDGEAFNATAAADTFKYLTSKAGKASAIGGSYPQLKTAKILNPYTIEILTNTPDPILPKEIDQVNIVAPKAWHQLGPSGFATHPVGTGPYKATSWGPNAVVLSRFAGSWRHSHYKTITFDQIGDPTARYQALESNQAQIDYDLSLEQLTTIGGGLHLVKQLAAGVVSLQFLQKHGGPVLKPAVRVALNEAIDRPLIMSKIFHNVATPGYQGAAPDITGYDSHLGPIKYNPTGAKKLLATAGYPHGLSLQAQVVVGSVPGDSEMIQAVVSDLAKIGVHLTANSVPFGTWLSDFLSDGFSGQMASILYAGAPQFDAALPLSRGSCLQKPAVLWCEQSQAKVISKIETDLNPKTRNQLFDQLAAMQRSNPPALWMYNLVDATGVSNSVSAAYTPIGSLDFSSLAPS